MVFNRLKQHLHRGDNVDLGSFRALFERFQRILSSNSRTLEIMSELEDKLSGEYIFDSHFLVEMTAELSDEIRRMISNLNVITDNRYPELFSRQHLIQGELKGIIEDRPTTPADEYVIDFDEVDSDAAATVGGKSANLGEIRNRLGMAVPEGFVLTVAAYRRFMEYNELWPKIRSLYQSGQKSGGMAAEQYDRAIDELFAGTRVPPDVAQSLARHLDALWRRKKKEFGVAVRSSACGEDTESRSFAGQFESYLHCGKEDVSPAYTRVIASRFKNTIAVYAGERVIKEEELPMAVAVQETIAAGAAGVLYSVDPGVAIRDTMSISSCIGLGVNVVEGTVNADSFQVSRFDPARITGRRVATKKTKVVLADPQGTESVPVPEEQQAASSLSDTQVTELAKGALLLERYFKRPVDVEWCFDAGGRLFILQCRPLGLPVRPLPPAADLTELLAGKPIIMRDRGVIAQRGIAAGRVWQVNEDDDPNDFPVGAIAVTRYTTPRLTSIIRRAAAIVTDIGNSSGHMATVAREFGVPMIVNATDATSLLRNGEEVTVDAEENIIYQGIVTELLQYEMEAEDVFRDLREYLILRRLLRKITPLSLIDPGSPDFSARNCRTYHDIVRFTHEKAVQYLIDLNISSHRFRGIESKPLALPIPLGLSVIDLGGALNRDVDAGKIDSVESVTSTPLRAVLKGLLTPGVWSTQPAQLRLGDLVSSMTRYKMTDRIAEYRGANLAVVSECYMNMSLRLGYHFNVIDTHVCGDAKDNYIYFRFVGGVTESERRHLRALLIKQILEKMNFKVTVTGDLVVGRLKLWEAQEISRSLEEIGRLIGFTRQLDTQMESPESIRECYRTFFDGKGDDGG